MIRSEGTRAVQDLDEFRDGCGGGEQDERRDADRAFGDEDKHDVKAVGLKKGEDGDAEDERFEDEDTAEKMRDGDAADGEGDQERDGGGDEIDGV